VETLGKHAKHLLSREDVRVALDKLILRNDRGEQQPAEEVTTSGGDPPVRLRIENPR